MISHVYSNLLLDKLPTRINGLDINTNFRNGILFELLMQDSNLSKEEKVTQALKIFFKSYDTVSNAINTLLYFYTCVEETKNNKVSSGQSVKVIYSFEHDSNYIFSAFLSQYNIDLNAIEYMHWWKFKALFESLNEDHMISKIMSYRAMDLSQIKDKEQRKYYRKLKMKYRLPDTRSDQEKERDFANILG
jgi:hypothetical protein